jgi:mutator protein MutT
MGRHHIQADGLVHGVVAAVRRDRDGRWLCVRRSAHVAAPRRVCFPGGGVDAGETPEQAIVREIREELGIAVRPLRHVWTWAAADRPLRLLGFLCEWTAGDLRPDPAEIEEVLWLSGEEVTHHSDAMPTNRDFVLALESADLDPG